MLPPLESKLKMAACFRTVPQKKIPAVNMSSCPHIHFECLVCRKNAVLTLRHVPRMSPSSIVFRLLFRLPQPGEEGRDGLEGHTLTMLLGGVFARLPLVESVLRDDVLVIQTVKEHPEKVWKSKETLSSLFLAVIWNCKLTFGFWRLNMKKNGHLSKSYFTQIGGGILPE